MTTLKESKSNTLAAPTRSGCCGGPAPEGTVACCVKDADAKANGEVGCGCGTASTQGDGSQDACCSTGDQVQSGAFDVARVVRELPGTSAALEQSEGRLATAAAKDDIRQAVREQYGRVAAGDAGCGCGDGCCDGPAADASTVSQRLGYTAEDVRSVPAGANMGLGCGNPQAIANLKPGETVLDLGSGGGFDCFLAARQVGHSGQVIGVDMTPAMISKARTNAEKGGYDNVEFRLGEIESLPVADAAVDVIISNCVINLSPDKPRVFAEAYRVLKPGGRLAVSDVVAFAELPEDARRDLALHTGCIAGASPVREVETMLIANGFEQVRVAPKVESQTFLRDWVPGTPIADYVVSATIEAVKPARF